MKILSCAQIREVDQLTIANEPIISIDLMERAAMKCADWITNQFGNNLSIKIFAGPGNNGGDGLAIARLLSYLRNNITVYLLFPVEKFSPDALVNYTRLTKLPNVQISALTDISLPEITETDMIIDALFGSGLTRPLETLAASTVHHINYSNAKVIAIDIPSGLYGENNTHNNPETIIKADYTLTFQIPKLSFFFSENEKYTGDIHVLDIGLWPEAIEKQVTRYYQTSQKDIYSLLKKRTKFSHKGTYGHALLISGSYGKMGATILSAHACLRSGVGLLTCHIPKCGYNIIQTAIPEAMVSADNSENFISTLAHLDKYSAVGIGPGLDTNNESLTVLSEVLQKTTVPLVIDADALNLLSIHPELFNNLPPDTILTPHPGEFDRLTGPAKSSFERNNFQIEFSKKHNVIVILKGANTSITTSSGDCYFNTTGNPGMATAGSGDVLTGIILSLLAQKYTPINAALIGVYIHGLAGDLAMESLSAEALIATDIINNLGNAFKKLK